MMKTLLLFLILPFAVFAQSDLVKWNAASSGNRNTPVYDTNLLYTGTSTSPDFTVNGSVSLNYNTDDVNNPYFSTGNWPTTLEFTGSYDPSKYVEFKITPKAGNKIDLSSFTITYRVQSGTSQKFQIQYSKDPAFTTGVKVLVPETVTATTWTTINPLLSAELNPVLPGQVVYVRLYAYNSNNNFHFRTGINAGNLPAILKGTVSTFDSSKILAINDYLTTKKEIALNISPLSNDVQGSSVASITISTPPAASEGTAILNPDKTITFNPAKNFTGTSTFKYTITKGTDPSSTANIQVTIADLTADGLVIWDAKTSTNRFKPTVNTSYITGSDIPSAANPAVSFNNSEDASNPFYQSGGWPTPGQNGGGYDLAKYVEFKIKADANHKIDLSTFLLTYRSQGGSGQKLQILYSKSSTFTGTERVLFSGTTTSTWNTIEPSFASDLNTLSAGETLYIRAYAYNTNNQFHFRATANIKGIVKDTNTLTASNDYVSTPTNQAVTIPILDNDVIGSSSALQAITVTQPSNGTVTVNGLNNITFTPASGFTGTATFTYTLKNAASNYSSATVTVTGTAPLCVATPTAGINYWKGFVYTYTGNTPATTTYVGSIAEKPIFDRNVGTAVITGDASVEANAFCGTAPSDKFLVRYLMQTNTTAGIYNFTIGGDDGVRLYIDGTLVPFNPSNSWSDHSYTSYSTQYTFATAGAHNFVLEYYENGEASRVSFSYGEIKGDTSFPFGDNKWNVYGFNSPDIALVANSYAGTYVATGVNINTQTYWNATLSPSSYSGWQGAPMPVDQFAITYKRQGFACGRYQLQLVNCDDIAEVYIDGTKIFTQNGYTNTTSMIPGTYPLNKTSKVEVRLREDGGNANVAINFIDTPFTYDGSVAPATGSSITVNSDLTLSNDLEVCTCTIATGKTLTIPENKTLTVNENIIVNTNGKLVIKNNGSLVQTNNNATYTGAADSFDMERISYPMKNYDYTYWSSAVAGRKLNAVSPNTLADKYMSYSGTNWVIESGNNVMTPGKGYIIRVPTSGYGYPNGKDYWTGPTYAQTVNFIGIPNNGIITGESLKANNYYLIGNPYPSALDANKFLSENTFINGTLYFWTHNTLIGTTAKYEYNSNDYASYNLTGGTATAPSSAPGANKNIPSGKVAAGESFFVSANADGIVKFNNLMRPAGDNNQFFKPAKTSKTTTTEKSRVWLNMTNKGGAFKQTLIGYVEGATNDFENRFDGLTFDGNDYIDFFSYENENSYVIQGRAVPFVDTDIVPLGYRTTIEGDFTISIEQADGDLAGQSIYLEDKTTGKIQDLRAGKYTFTTTKGNFTDRFILRYTNKTLGTGDFENIEKDLIVSVKNKVIKVTSTTENIKEVTIYDISGKLLYNKKKVGATELQISNLQSGNQVLFTKVILENDHVASKKIIFN
ncbi:hypothetical protein D0809_24160 [Flavobacterium circumlabens]|uniref:PA14 domain-containing protein n=1 Tax=Flavobacterium circumlabens TaxID=2133765 RepID=A0A4Y7U5I8_9FLAO|nr:Ig-like domain-containing protein [Flavobacterium circumlabens]TCN49904.1 PA14 domain-containing protein [Flavobacterium circumlabens]TEB41695.1 hypothetical protein D0809_24160 [Flavobacterium circumlabens]